MNGFTKTSIDQGRLGHAIGRLVVGAERITRTAYATSSATVGPLNPNGLRIDHDLGSQLDVHARVTSGGLVQITAAFVPEKPGSVNGSLVIHFNQASLPPLKLPVIAHVVASPK